MEAVLSAPDSFADVQCSELLQSATHEKGDAKENCCHHWLPRRWQPLQRREEWENQSNVSLLPTTEAKESVKLGEQPEARRFSTASFTCFFHLFDWKCHKCHCAIFFAFGLRNLSFFFLRAPFTRFSFLTDPEAKRPVPLLPPHPTPT